ncbi:thioesterase domain-containing protein [Xanthomonas sacchari]|uniref:YiiD C-terminal domain-containing protein n=1 Tax=Xanthomonas sacchari TaxID=56458 RepID=UPI0020C4AB76|nr:YiiD C-terminal domain-containing protein [Xanthomonas sacchari]MDQ1091349.1 thioesterase domain-containing protein [Xanthomonas sacchari]
MAADLSFEAFLQQLQRQFQAMPPVAALQVALDRYADQRLHVVAPLAANINDKGNAFGGSLGSVMTLAGWGLINCELHRAGLQADVYVADSQVRYLAPLYADLHAQANADAAGDWEVFVNTFRQRGRARIGIQAQVGAPGAAAAATLSGRFVAIAKG